MEHMTFDDAENAQKDLEMVRLVKTGVINPEPVFEIIRENRVFNGERETEESIDKLSKKKLSQHFETPAYARRVEEQL